MMKTSITLKFRPSVKLDKEDFKIKIYHSIFNKSFKDIGHRNVLGSIMTLGIERNTFGDIYIVDNNIRDYLLIEELIFFGTKSIFMLIFLLWNIKLISILRLFLHKYFLLYLN